MATSAEKLGNLIGSLIQSQSTTNANINGQEASTTRNKVIYEQFKLVGQAILTKKVPYTTSFQLDHPVYGELDSATLQLDGGYDASKETILEIQNF